MITTEEKITWLRLARSENVGKSTFFRLIESFGSAKNALEHLIDLSHEIESSKKIRVCSRQEAEKELSDTEKFDAEILLFSDPRYPNLLRKIPDPAPLLTIKGDIDFFEHKTVAVVGSRNASFNGIAFARKLAVDLGQNSIITISGMARGIDETVHEASILSGTIGIIGGGINNIYPSENHRIFQKVASRGLLITEQPYGAPPRGGNFVQRNRLISGLSLALIVVEAGLRSGSLTTARFAAEQGREVFAVPGSPFDPRYHGTNQLIKDGANMLESVDDILNELPNLRSRFSDDKNIATVELPGSEAIEQKVPSNVEIKKIRDEILQKLSFVPVVIEDIIHDLQLPPNLVNIAVVQLELAERIEVSFGKAVLKAS